MTPKDKTFNAIDVETANTDRASICQIGIVHVVDCEIQDTWKTYINPEDWFDPWIVDIHGITEDMVATSPTMPEVRDELRRRLRGTTVVSHTSFDRVAFERAMLRYGLEQLKVTWMDSARVARRWWAQYAKRGYGLKNIASDLGIEFNHHDALEDARATAMIMLRVLEESELGIQEWLEKSASPISGPRQTIAYKNLSGNVDGDLYGETLVFTGALAMARHEAAQKANDAGCNVVGTVSTKVSILVVGTQNKHKLKGMTKSNKHRKAEELIASGHEVQIISERDFLELIEI
ncbi:MAG: transposase [Gammaproteobacteria bacterium]|nr:transposase [Gammaproteobacteria bacterium]